MHIRSHLTSTTITILIWVLTLSGCAKDFAANPIAAGNPGSSPASYANYQATKNYYRELLAGTAPRLAELNLFTTMLPKGGDLHHHFSGAIFAETYLDWIDRKQYCICRANECKPRGGNNAEAENAPKFGILPEAPAGVCISAQDALKDNTFFRELLEQWSNKDYANHFHAQTAPDQQFFDTFGFFGPISNAYYHEGLLLLKQRASAENVAYIETMLKGAPSLENPVLENTLNKLSSDSPQPQIAAALNSGFDLIAADPATANTLDEYRALHADAATDIDDGDFKLRFQSYVSRNYDPAKVFSSMYFAFSAAKLSKLIVGVNMVGPENGYIAMRDYGLHMRMLRFFKQRFPEVKLALHAGELVLGMVPPEGLTSHINAAVRIAGAERVGHAVDIAHESDAFGLLDLMQARDTAVEINLTSNAFILGVKAEAHPVQIYRQHAVPFVISTDDAGVSRNNLSNEYLLFASRYQPDYDELKAVVYNSIHYSFLSAEEKRLEIQALDKRFEAFEALIAGQAGIAGRKVSGKIFD
jgi:adenosine deaminase/adenosine deaminase CECR1